MMFFASKFMELGIVVKQKPKSSPGFKKKALAILQQSWKICIQGHFLMLNMIVIGARLIFFMDLTFLWMFLFSV